jgi:hypothetical protein
MDRSIRKFTGIGCAIVVGLLISHHQLARAGWSVNVGFTTGQGTVTVKITSATGVVSSKTTPFMLNPSAAINQKSNFLFAVTNSLPAGANPGTYVQVRGAAFGKTSIQSTNVAGDIGDSDELLPFIIPTSACASAAVEIETIKTNANSVTFQYRAKLSDEGSAMLLRVVETNSLQQIQQKYLVLLVGPYDNTDPNSCEGTITVTGNLENMGFLLDGHTSTLPFSIKCPDDMVLGCDAGALTTYAPPAEVTSSLPYTLTYDPPPNMLLFGVTNIVTASATDINGCTVSCQFKVYRQPIDFDGFDSPIGGADATGGSCASPLRTFRLGNVVPVKFAMSCNGVLITGGVPPTIEIQGCAGNSTPYVGLFEIFNNAWHFNIDSTIIGAPGKYIVTAVLPDGSRHSVVFQYKR